MLPGWSARRGSAERIVARSLRRSPHRAAIRLRQRRGPGLPGRHLLRLLSDQLRPAGDWAGTPHAVLKIGPEVHSQPPARLLEAGERVPRRAARLTPRAPADLPLLDVVPKMPFAQVGV